MRGPAIATAFVLLAAGVAADMPDPEGWSRFRGPNGSGVSTSSRLPSEFGPDTNVVWKTELPFGHSSPALTRERIFLTAARGERVVTICLDRKSGRILCERDAPRSRVEKLDTRNGPAGPTPATDGINVYVSPDAAAVQHLASHVEQRAARAGLVGPGSHLDRGDAAP